MWCNLKSDFDPDQGNFLLWSSIKRDREMLIEHWSTDAGLTFYCPGSWWSSWFGSRSKAVISPRSALSAFSACRRSLAGRNWSCFHSNEALAIVGRSWTSFRRGRRVCCRSNGWSSASWSGEIAACLGKEARCWKYLIFEDAWVGETASTEAGWDHCRPGT